MPDKDTEAQGPRSRRDLLAMIGAVAVSAAMSQAMTSLQVVALLNPGWLVEIEVRSR